MAMDQQTAMEQLRELYREKNEHLERFLEPVTPFEFYRDIFPVGSFERKGHFEDEKGNGIAVTVPKAAGIGTAVVLRFFPTIAGEYRAIRSSQRFRGIGVGVLHTLTHLPTTVEYILIPLILRTTKVAEELSASMTVRGVRFSGETVSYRSIRFCWKDAALLALLLAVACTVLLLERGGVL